MVNGSNQESVIVTQGLTRRFGEFIAVDHVSLSVKAGEVFGYLGPNGSGKTTTIRMLLGLMRPSEGNGSVLGFDILREAEVLRQHVGYMSQKFALYQDLTVRENLQFYAGVYGVNDRARLQEVLELVGLVKQQKERINQLSAGWRQRLALGTAIVHQPRLLFLDEPTSGVDPNARRAFWDLIYELVDARPGHSGVTAFVTTHYMDEAEYCGRLGIMRDGKLLACDTPSNLKRDILPGSSWDIFLEGQVEDSNKQDISPLLTALDAMQHNPMIMRVSLVSDHLRLIAPPGTDQQALHAQLSRLGVGQFKISQVEPTLEDVFLSLATRAQGV
jgi:ABC-2 type transport system ATP-binding protein